MPRGGARPGAGRKRRDPSGVARQRPGPRLTDAEWAPVEEYAQRENIPITEAMRRLIAAGLAAVESGGRKV